MKRKQRKKLDKTTLQRLPNRWFRGGVIAFTVVATLGMLTLAGMPAAMVAQPPNAAKVNADEMAKNAKTIADLTKRLAAFEAAQKGGGGQPAVFKKGVNAKTGQPFPRGGRPSPRLKLVTTPPHKVVIASPIQFATVPKQLSYWYNNQYGICVTAQEAYSKAAWSVQCGLPELFVPDAEVLRWATKYGFRDGANLTDVMDVMIKDGFTVDGVNYKDGPYFTVDYSSESTLQNAIFTGPVNIAIDANALPAGAGNQMGWFATGGSPGQYQNTDHCVALSGYGPATYLYQQLGAPLPSGLDGTKVGYLLFTWNTIGFVDEAWIMSTVVEAWVRNPTTPGQVPNPPATITVPNVVGLTWARASAALTAVKLTIMPTTAPDPTSLVTAQSPVAGTQLFGPQPVTVTFVPVPPPTGEVTYSFTVSPDGTISPVTVGGKTIDPSELDRLAVASGVIADFVAGQQNDALNEAAIAAIPVFNDPAVQAQFSKAFGADYDKIHNAKKKLAHRIFLERTYHRMQHDPAGAKLLAEYKAGAPNPGWFQALLDWLLKNGPAIMAFIQMILKLFGLGATPAMMFLPKRFFSPQSVIDRWRAEIETFQPACKL